MATFTNQNPVNGTDEDDLIIGTDGNDSLYGGAGDDLISGGPGQDTIDGGLGQDVASYSGPASEYVVEKLQDGTWRVTDLDMSTVDEGVDTLSSVEVIRFSDEEYRIQSVYAPTGLEFRVNTTTINSQEQPSIAALADGGFIVTWMDSAQDGSGWGIYAQRYAADGTPSGGEFRVNTTTSNEQSQPSITALAGGGFVVSWTSNGQDGSGWGIYAQSYAANGSPSGNEFRVNSTTYDTQYQPSSTGLADGGFVLTWESYGQDGSGWGIYAQRYAADGTPSGSEFQVNTTTSSDQSQPSITALADGGFVVAWRSAGQDGSGWGIYAQRYAADGTPSGSEFQVNTTTSSDQSQPSITALADGGFVVAWRSAGQDGSGGGVFAQRYASNGTPIGGEFKVNTEISNNQEKPNAIALADGGFVVTWMSYDQDGSASGIFAQRYAADGTPSGGEFRVNTTTHGDQDQPSIVSLAGGGFVVAWMDWGQDGSSWGIYAQRFASDEQLLVGDSIIGGAGHDLLQGAEGNDTLTGGAGNDTVDGGAGFNTYRVTGSADAFYWSVNALGELILTDAVVDPADPIDGSDEGVDTLRNIQVIEYVRPDGTLESAFQVDDHGNAADAGNAQIQYGVWVNGRANFYGDTDWFRLDTVAGQKVVLSGANGSTSGYLTDSAGNGVYLQGNYSVIWGSSNETLTWNSTGTSDVQFWAPETSSSSPMVSRGYSFILRRELKGTGGADALVAGADFERLIGGSGDDTLTGSDRADVLLGGDGNDVLTGGQGYDEIDGGAGTANTAVFSGNKADYTVTWTGSSNLGLRLADNVAGRDGVDQLSNIQVLRFADGDVVLDAESNVPTSVGAVSIGQAMTGSLPATNTTSDVDYFQQRFAADISSSSALRISIEGSGTSAYGQLYAGFYLQGTSDVLTFKNLSNNTSISQFSASISSGSQSSWIVSPQYWGSSSEFIASAQRADVEVWGHANGSALGDLASYSIRVDRVLFGTTGSDTLLGDGLAGYIDARDGNDIVTGSEIDEEIVGGAGDDTLSGGAGNDRLVDGWGVNILSADEGDDFIDVSASMAPTATIDGGTGVDTLKIASDTYWDGLTVSGVEILDGGSGRSSLTPEQLLAKGFTTAENITFRLDSHLANGGTLDASGLSGKLNLRGTNQSDTLIGNAGNNTIYLTSDENDAGGAGADTVSAGAGDDTIVVQTQSGRPWSKFFTAADHASRTYAIRGNIDGGAGTDRFELNFQDLYWVQHAWGGHFYESSWKLDLSQLSLTGVETLAMLGNAQGQEYPREIILTATQIAGLSSTSGLPAVSIVGGGEIDLAHLTAIGIGAWRIGDNATYVLMGSGLGESVTVGSGAITVNMGDGNDEIIIDSKPLVSDVIDGGAGSDTLTIRGSDIDLSGATLSNIEAIKVSAQSLSMTEAQWQALGGIVSRVTGASTNFILSVTTPGTSTLTEDAPYVGLTGSAGDDVLVGNAAANVLVGGEGNDSLIGNAGDDRLVSGVGVDTLDGGEGNDTLVVTGKTTVRDQLSGGAGTDTLVVSDGQNFTTANISGIEVLKGSGTVTMTAEQLLAFTEIQGVAVQLSGTSTTFSLGSTKLGSGAAVLLPTVDPLVAVSGGGVVGSKGDDTLTGSEHGDRLLGGRGADLLSGGAGSDTLIGGSGFDTLSGDAGDDRIVVEAGEFAGATSQTLVVTGVQGTTGYFDHRSSVVSADSVDGGAGNDTLAIDFGSHYGAGFVVNAGLIANVENLELSYSSSNAFVAIDASTFKQFSSVTAKYQSGHSSYRHDFASLGIFGFREDLNLDNLAGDAKIREIVLQGQFGAIDARNFVAGPTIWSSNDYDSSGLYYSNIRVYSFDSIQLSAGNDGLIIKGDNSFSVRAGAGDDKVRIQNISGRLTAVLDGDLGDDTLDVATVGFLDLSNSTITNFETIRHGNTTLVVTQAQLDSLSFDGSGAKYTKVGSDIVGTSGNDSYTGDGTGSFEGGKGNDSISNINTAAFSGNYADYDFVRSGNTLTVQHARGSLSDGTDTVSSVMNLQFADTTLKVDDNPDNVGYFFNSPNWGSLTHAEYDKRVSAKKDYDSDVDVFSATLAPNSPLAIEGSTLNGNGWSYSFYDSSTGGQLSFKSLVYGWEYGAYYDWMSAGAKWLPMLNGKPYEGGDVVIRAEIGGTIQDYAFTLKYLDDYAGSIDTLGQMNAQTGVIKGYIGDINDADWIRTDLIAGTKYEFHLKGLASGGGTLVDPKLQLRDSAGRLIESGIDLVGDAVGNDDVLIFRPTASGSYYLAVSDVAGLNKGSWTLTQQSLDTVAGNLSTTERIEWSGGNTFMLNSEVNVLTDRDWFKVWLDKGITYNFRALGASDGGTLADPQLSLRSATGILLAQDDNSGGGTDAKLVFAAPDSGWYFLDAGASGNASKGTYILRGSTLADDFSNDVFTTGVVQSGASLQGLVSYIGDSDWVKVGLSKGVTYVIDLVGDISDGAQLDPLIDPLLTLRDANGSFIARFDDFGGTLNARAYFTPTADGLFHLEARSAFKYDIGAWKLSVTQAPADDFAAAMDATAASLALGAAQQGEIGIPGDRDVFKVALEAGRVYELSVEGLAGHAGTLADPYLRVFDSAGRLVDFDNNGGAGNDARMYFAPGASGTYYIEASSNHDRSMGSYSLTVAQRDLPVDDVPNNLGTQVFLNPGDSFSGNLLTHNDQDWFGIRLTGGEDYVFRLQASHSGNGSLADPVLEVRAADGTLLKSVNDMLMGNEPALAFTPVGNGTYYLVVKAADGQTDTGTYTLLTRAPDDHSNTKPGATAIALDQTLAGAIQWSDGAFGVRAFDSVGLATDFDEDWFKFDAQAEQVLSVNVRIASDSALSRPMVEVVDSQGRSLAIGDGLETRDGLAVASFKTSAAGSYYARVIDGAGATGAYQISLTAGDASDEDAAGAVVLDFADLGSIIRAETTARIGLAGDTDAFAVSLQEGHNYRIETLAVRDGTHAPLPSAQLALSWLAQGTAEAEAVAVEKSTASPSFFDSTLFSAATNGTLSLNVSALDATQTGQYKLRVIDLGSTQADDRPDLASDYGAGGIWAVNESAQGRIDHADDVDLFSISLTAGNVYDFAVKSYVDGLGTLAQAELRLLDIDGHLVTAGTFDSLTGRTQLPVSVFEDGRYFLAVSAADLAGNIGTYVLDTRLRGSDEAFDDISADTRSGVTAVPGQPARGTINYSTDHDWIKTTLQAGKVYVLDVLADGDGAGGTLKDATLRLLDAQGAVLAFDDNSGAARDAHLQFTATTTGDYFLDVGSNGGEVGSYTVRVRELYSGEADPLRTAQWYLGAAGVDSLQGQLTGAGVKVGVVDDGIDTSHPDLQNQLDFALAYDTQFDTRDGMPKYPVLVGPPDNHGTLVAGIIAAEANNETGIVGVAPDAELVSTRVKWTWDQITEALGLQWQFDVSNNSWGAIHPFGDNFNSTSLTFAWQALRTGVEDGRDGLGTVFVFSAGNGAGNGDNTNYHNFQNAREVIAVGAAQADGSMAGFSTPGANVLVSSYGVGMLTTDRHQPGWGANPFGNYADFNGTSAAAPMVSGVVALMLEANPGLGYRDVQEILVYSATHSDSQDWKTNGASAYNLGGLRFNDKAGFGVVDAYTAVRLAQTWTDVSTSVNEVSASARQFGMMEAIPDGNGSVYTKTFTIDSALNVEHVELGVDLRHTRLGDLIIELTSPNGTVSTLMNRPTVNAEQPFGLYGADSVVPTHLLWDFSSVQFWGEEASGTWTVTIKDVRAEETGLLHSLSLRVYGERDDGDDTYVFTEEGFDGNTTRVLSDESGEDTLNASPLRQDTYIDLDLGLIASRGITYGIADWTVIEHAITGSGNDRLDGNNQDNRLNGMEGSDTLTGGLGNDTLIGGAGADMAYYAGALPEYSVSWNPDARTITVVDNKSSNGDDGTDTLIGIERIVFNDGEISLGAMVGNRAPVANTTYFDTPVFMAAGAGIEYAIPDNAFNDGEDSGAGTLVIEVSDASGAELPAWLSYDPVTKTLTGVPPEDYQGQLALLVEAIDEYGDSTSDILTLQFGDNQAPVLQPASETVLPEDAGLVALGIAAPFDPEGKVVSVELIDLPAFGDVLDKQGNKLAVGAVLSADELSELHYQTQADAFGDAGYLRYRAIDEDGVTAQSSIHIFIDPVNDAPRFATASGKLIIDHPAQATVTLDMLAPVDPESTLSVVRVIGLPEMGQVMLDDAPVRLDQVLTLDQLQRLTFSLSENVNGPIGAVTIQAVDPQGAATNWSLALEVQGDSALSAGTAGADALYGSIGNDTLQGLAGNDTLVGNAGADRLLGGLGNDSLFGGSGNDVLDGSSGNDYLDGGTGDDIMSGGPGNDTFIVDAAGDAVLEVIGGGAGGTDLIVTSVSRSAPLNVENLQAAAGAAIDLTGNELDNVLIGNAEDNALFGAGGRDTLIGGDGRDTLDGGSGVDRLAGGAGDDLYFVDSRSDAVVELAGEGIDTVRANSSFTLPSNVRHLILEEGGDYSAGGNSLDNHLVGNSGNNVLAGGLGRDTLEGGLGDDVYVLSDTLDQIIDTGGEDTIRSTLDVYLPDDIERIELVGIRDTVGIGNGADNVIVGNMGNNILDGQGGVDTLTGGAGDDQFIVAFNGAGLAADTITDFTSGSDLLIIDLASFGIDVIGLELDSSGLVASQSFVKGAGVRPLDPDDHYLMDTATGLLTFDPDGSGALESVTLVQLVGDTGSRLVNQDLFIAV